MPQCRIAATVYMAMQVHATVKATDARVAVSRFQDCRHRNHGLVTYSPKTTSKVVQQQHPMAVWANQSDRSCCKILVRDYNTKKNSHSTNPDTSLCKTTPWIWGQCMMLLPVYTPAQTGTNLYCLVTEEHGCEQRTQHCCPTEQQLGIELVIVNS